MQPIVGSQQAMLFSVIHYFRSIMSQEIKAISKTAVEIVPCVLLKVYTALY